MKKIAVLALKGGVGKSSIVAGTVLALVKKGFKVGALDIDVTGSNLYSALGLEHSPRWQLDTANEKIIVPKANGYWLLSIASHVGEDYAVLWGRSQHLDLTSIRDELKGATTPDKLEALIKKIDGILSQSKWHFVSELLSDEIVTWPEPLNFLIVDLPPSTSEEMFSFFYGVKDIFGVIIVSLPTQIANIGLTRTIDLLRVRQIPIIGLVANMDGFLTQSGRIEYQFLSPRVDLEGVAKKAGIPFLVSIPQMGDNERSKAYFSELAEKVIGSKPVVLKEVTIARKLKRKIIKGIARRI